jgi:hypothetical protein
MAKLLQNIFAASHRVCWSADSEKYHLELYALNTELCLFQKEIALLIHTVEPSLDNKDMSDTLIHPGDHPGHNVANT